MTNSERAVVYVLSDSIGETGEFVAKAAASQFNGELVEVRRIPFIADEEALREAVNEAKETGGVVVYTMVIPQLRKLAREYAEAAQLPFVDVMGPMMDAMEQVMPNQPRLQPGLVRKLDEHYFKRVEAIEFAVKYDDGKDPRGLGLADLVLIGVSRTSKTPLSMYLAHKQIKVANVPLVPEVQPPEELYNISRDKIVGLTISPEQLNEIRRERLATMGLRHQSNYATLERIFTELEFAQGVMKRIGCPIFDVTNKAVEETAGKLLDLIRRRHDE
ncbi:MAG: kinase/pyrophosphorylase [Firmicutes bacterium]|nr:kinase/pyrophosphorylase [Bacillota bacterium]